MQNAKRTILIIMLVCLSFVLVVPAGTVQRKPEKKPAGTWDLIRKSQLKQTSSIEAPGKERVVHLPKDRSIGQVSLVEMPLPKDRWWNLVSSWNSKRLGAVWGDVTIPADRVLWLQIIGNIRQKGRALSFLKPNDVQILTLYHCPDVDDVLMQDLVRLTGLEMIVLGDGTFTLKGLRNLTKLKQLKALVLPGYLLSQDMAFLRELPSLEYLHFGGQMGPMVTDDKIAEIGRLTWLTQLSLRGTEVGEGLAHLKGLKALRFLDLKGNTNVDIDKHLAHVASFTELEYLDLRDTQIGDAGMAHLTGLTKLRKLYVSSNPLTGNISDAGMAYLKNLKSLEDLGLPFRGITDAGIEHLTKLDSLKKINISGDGITDKSLKIIAKMKSVEDLKILDHNHNITDAGIKELAESTSLKALYIQGCSITNKGLASLSKMITLTKLKLIRLQINGEGLAALKELPNLTDLFLDSLPLGEKRITHLANLSKLERLFLHDPGMVLGDEDLVHLGNLVTLEYLEIQSKSDITNEGLSNLSGLNKLNDLSIPANISITNDGLKHLSNLTALERLRINNSSITDAGLKHLENLTSLRSLILYKSRITKSGAARLEKKIPGLKCYML